MDKLLLSKMNGAGNSFYLLDLRSNAANERLQMIYPNLSRSEISKEICSGYHSSSAVDGIVFVVDRKNNSTVDFEWDFYNADGSVAEMCGNAARCVASFAHTRGFAEADLRFGTLAGTISAKVFPKENRVDITMTNISDEKWDQTVTTKSSGEISYCYINSGVPHVVITIDNISDRKKMALLAQELREPQFFKPKGANITFLQEVSKTQIKSVSFERGVEDFTLACGTGAVAAARVHCGPPNCTGVSEVTVFVPGGELAVHFRDKNPHLIGPVEFMSETEMVIKGE